MYKHKKKHGAKLIIGKRMWNINKNKHTHFFVTKYFIAFPTACLALKS